MNEAAFVKKIKGDEIAGGTSPQKDFSPLFQLARVLVRFKHIVRFIVNANHGIMRATAKLALSRARRRSNFLALFLSARWRRFDRWLAHRRWLAHAQIAILLGRDSRLRLRGSNLILC